MMVRLARVLVTIIEVEFTCAEAMNQYLIIIIKWFIISLQYLLSDILHGCHFRGLSLYQDIFLLLLFRKLSYIFTIPFVVLIPLDHLLSVSLLPHLPLPLLPLDLLPPLIPLSAPPYPHLLQLIFQQPYPLLQLAFSLLRIFLDLLDPLLSPSLLSSLSLP